MGLSGCLPSGEEMGGASADEELGTLADELSESAVRARVVGSNTDGKEFGDLFGWSLALSDDGLTMVVGATGEDSRSASEPGDNSLPYSGAAYVFVRKARDANWVQQGYLKASNPDKFDEFGHAVAISGDGKYVAVGAWQEMSDGSSQSNNSKGEAGAVYVYRYDVVSGHWVQDAYVKPSHPVNFAAFGASVALSTDGSTLAVGAFLAGDHDLDETAFRPGQAYVFRRGASGWTEQALLEASNADEGDDFGYRVALDGSGNLLAVSATQEASGAVGVDGNQDENLIGDFGSPIHAGAVYVFKFENGSGWKQQSYIKASNTDTFDEGDMFGRSLALSSDGSTLAVGTEYENSDARMINGDQTSNAGSHSGAAYVFRATANGSWAQEAYVKANNADEGDYFGCSIALSNNGDYLVVGALYEDSAATQAVGGDPFNNDDANRGAAYVFARTGTEWAQQAYLKPAGGNNKHAGTTQEFGRSVDVNGAGDVIAVGANRFTRNRAGVFTFTDP
jgi:hypothetical protein